MGKLFAQLGLHAALVTVLAYLWQQGAYQYLPAVLAASAWLAIYFFKLHHRVPLIQGHYAELDALNQGSPFAVSARLKAHIQTTHSQLGQHRFWTRWLAGTESTFNTALGPQIWTYQAFNRLLGFAYVYPMMLLLLIWFLFDQGVLGQTKVLPEYGSGSFGKRAFVILCLCAPSLWAYWIQARIDTRNATDVGKTRPMHLLTLAIYLLSWTILTLFLVSILPEYFQIPLSFVLTLYLLTTWIPLKAVNVRPAAFAIAIGAIIAGATSLLATLLILALVFFLIVNIRARKSTEILKVFTAIFTITIVTTLAVIVPPMSANGRALTADNVLVAFLVFLCILPVCNALFDWVSVGVTRYFLRVYAQRGRNSAWLIVADIVVAVFLTVGLHGAVLGVLWWMQRWGWGIDAQALIHRFRDNPLDPQVSWIALMAVTNMLPTFYHLALCVLGWLTRGITFGRVDIPAAVESLAQALALTPASSLVTAGGAPTTPPAKPRTPLSKAVLDGTFNFFYVDHWMALLMVFAFICAVWEPYLWLLAWCLGVLVS